MVKGVTKYAKMITEPQSIKQELEKAINLAISGRPGPVWLDIPLNVQGAPINELSLLSKEIKNDPLIVKDKTISKVINEMQEAKRPVLVAGHGIRIAKAEKTIFGISGFVKNSSIVNI